jgi:cytochrome b6
MLLKLSQGGLSRRLSTWLDERLHADLVLSFLKQKTVPNHRYTFWYLFGGLTLFFFIIQVLSGILLLIYYKPTPETAYESVKYLMEEVPYGNYIRSAHVWSAHLMVASVFVHMFSVYFMKAYRKPREVMWLSGFLLLLGTLGFGFTGYLLPWDMTAYFATKIGTEIPRSIPIIGEPIVYLLRGGAEVNGETLTRLFALHVVVLPLSSLALIVLHVLLNQVLGTSKPIGIKETGAPIPFLPNFLVREWVTWLIASSILVPLALSSPWPLGPRADPFESAPVGIRPEWYFWSLYQTLNLVPAQILSVRGEIVVNVALFIAGVFWWMIPFIDWRARENQKSPTFTLVGVFAIVYLAGMTIWVSLKSIIG